MFAELMTYYLKDFQQRGEQSLKDICNLTVPSEVVLWEYKKLQPIEQMDKNEKIEMKKYIIEIFPNKTVKEKMDCCRIVYTIGSLI